MTVFALQQQPDRIVGQRVELGRRVIDANLRSEPVLVDGKRTRRAWRILDTVEAPSWKAAKAEFAQREITASMGRP